MLSRRLFGKALIGGAAIVPAISAKRPEIVLDPDPRRDAENVSRSAFSNMRREYYMTFGILNWPTVTPPLRAYMSGWVKSIRVRAIRDQIARRHTVVFQVSRGSGAYSRFREHEFGPVRTRPDAGRSAIIRSIEEFESLTPNDWWLVEGDQVRMIVPERWEPTPFELELTVSCGLPWRNPTFSPGAPEPLYVAKG